MYFTYDVSLSDVRKQMAISGHISQSELTEKLRKLLDILTGNAPNTQSSLRNASVASSAPSTPQSTMTSDDKYSLLCYIMYVCMYIQLKGITVG